MQCLAGVESFGALKELQLWDCGVTSLQPLSHRLGPGLQKLYVSYCRQVEEEVLELPHVQLTAEVKFVRSNVREVVLAGGIRRAVGDTDSE